MQSSTRRPLPLGLTENEYRRLSTWVVEIAIALSPGASVRRGTSETRIGQKGSLVVNHDGHWHSFEADEGGHDACSLLAFLRPDADPIELRQLALAWLRDHPGLGAASDAPSSREEMERAAGHAALCRQVLGAMVPCPDTLAETYLQSRGLPPDWPTSLFGFVSDDDRPDAGATVTVITDANGVPAGIQLGYLDAAGQKAEIGGATRRQFLINKEAKGLRFHIAPLEPDPALPLLITEGIENALSLALAYPQAEIFGLPGIGRMKSLPPIKGRDVVVFADGDGPDARATRVLHDGIDHLLLGGAKVKVTSTPLDEDANSLLQTAGIPALQALVDTAAPAELSLKGVIKYLAALADLDFQQVRRNYANKFGIKVNVLDAYVARERARRRGEDEAPEDDPEVYPDPIHDIAEVLDTARNEVALYVVADPLQLDMVVLWALHTHFVHHATIDIAISPRLLITAATAESGKTTTLEAVGELSARPLEISSIRASGFSRLNDAEKPTLLIDEIQGMLARRGGNEELEAILLASHRRRSAKVVRVEQQPDGSFAPVTYDAWGTYAATLNGRLSYALETRCLKVRLRRALAGEVRAHLQDGTSEVLVDCRRKFARWARDQMTLPGMTMPAVLANRLGDNWRPLFRIAQLAGGDWPDKAMAAALASVKAIIAPDTVIALLTDAREVFGARDRLLTSELVNGLLHLEEPSKDWSACYRGGPINDYWLRDTLAEVLDPPGSHRWKLDGRDRRGYLALQFEDAYHRYLKPDNHSEQAPEQRTAGYTHTKESKQSAPSDASGAKTKKRRKRQRKSPASDASDASDGLSPLGGHVPDPPPEPPAPQPDAEGTDMLW